MPSPANNNETSAVICRRAGKDGERAWYAEVAGTPAVYFQIIGNDAWNFDIFVGLPVKIKKIPGGRCRILARLKGSKNFRQIE